MVEKIAPAEQTEWQMTRWTVSVADYHRLSEAGILGEDDRIELIDGEVRLMSPIGKRHIAIVNRYASLLFPQAGKTFIVSVQNPLVLDDKNEPEPDLVLLKYREDFYEKELAKAGDVLLAIEVSDSTLSYDRQVKLPLYARAGIPEVWITNVSGESIERHTDPQGDQYATKQTFKREQSITSQALPNITLEVDSILGQV